MTIQARSVVSKTLQFQTFSPFSLEGGHRRLAQFHHQLQQVACHPMGIVAGDQSLARIHFFQQILAQDRFHAERLNRIHVGLDLRLLLSPRISWRAPATQEFG